MGFLQPIVSEVPKEHSLALSSKCSEGPDGYVGMIHRHSPCPPGWEMSRGRPEVHDRVGLAMRVAKC